MSEFNSEIEGSLAFCALILPFGVFVCVENDVCEDGVYSVYI